MLADTAMADHGDERTHTLDLRALDARRHEADAVRRARHNVAPRIADERVTIGMTPFAIRNRAAGLAAGGKIGLGFDGTGTRQHLPVILAGLQRECGGKHDDIGTGLFQLQIKFGKADVVADRAADLEPVKVIDDNILARLDSCGFLYRPFRPARRCRTYGSCDNAQSPCLRD